MSNKNAVFRRNELKSVSQSMIVIELGITVTLEMQLVSNLTSLHVVDFNMAVATLR